MPVLDFLKGSRQQQNGKKLEEIEIDKIVPNPGQPRTTFDEDALAELADSIKQVGLIQPLLVRKTDGDTYELVAGERRLRACKMLGYSRVTCIVQNDMDIEESALVALIENLQRENLHYMEEARCYATLIETYGLTQEQLAMRLGRSQSSIANKLRLLKLDDEVCDAITEAGLTERHAREILRIKDKDEQLKAVEAVKKDGLSVKDTERLVSKKLDEMYTDKKPGSKPRPIILRVMKDYRLFMNTINDAVNILRDSGLTVDVMQTDREDGVDIEIHVTNNLYKD